MKRLGFLAAAILILITALTGCGRSNSSASKQMYDSTGASSEAATEYYPSPAPSAAADMAAPATEASSFVPKTADSAKMIYTASAEV